MSMLLMMLITSTISFFFMTHPLSMVLILLTQTIIISLMLNLIHYTSWFSYILFLTMIGGLLILFMYMTSTASNEMFKFSWKLAVFMTTNFLITWVTMMFTDLFMMENKMMNQELIKMLSKNNTTLSMNKFINFPSNLTMYTVITYLLITLIAMVKMINIKQGPLQQKL